MNDSATPTSTGEESWEKFVLMFSLLAMVSILAPVYWKLLPAVQSRILPRATGGANGPWVVRPDLGHHIMGVAVLTLVTVFVLLVPLSRLLRRPDARSSTREGPSHGQPVRNAVRMPRMLKAAFLLLVYCLSFMLYFFSWTTVGPNGIEERLPWRTRHHSFQEVESLESIPDGMRSDALEANGPWLRLNFRGGTHLDFSLDNEGMRPEELNAIKTYAAARSGLPWETRSDIRNYP